MRFNRHNRAETVRVAIVDDQALFRKGLISLLEEFEHLDVMLEASNGKDFFQGLRRCREELPHVVILDIQMPEMDGIETLIRLNTEYPNMHALMLTMHNETEIIFHLVDKGAKGFLLKDAAIETVVRAIDSIMASGFYFPDNISKSLVKGMVSNQKSKQLNDANHLSEREIEIIRLICKEFSSQEIADKLNISLNTVNKHRESIFQKINAKNVVGVVMYALKNNLVS
ncbi:MAG: response regulator transcription factor [Sediminibacterium sp.]|nr:response regulator transcription factor [Sediminibacterium sp.]